MKKLISLFFAVVLLSISPAYAQNRQLVQEDAKSERRVALVIGNSAYETAPLTNPVNDAHDIAQALRDLGFDVIHKENVNQNDMKRAIRDFGEKIRNSSVALFYYAGHGIQVNGQNYLIPVGATIEKEEEVEYEGVDAGFVLAQMENARSRTNIVILDACRNNPFARSFRSATRGLASINAPSGTLIAYATAPGSVASDGSDRNGLYTQELLKNLQISGLDVEEVFKRVRIAVREKSQGKQTPWESSSLVGDFYFINITINNTVNNSSVAEEKPKPSRVVFEEHFNNNNRRWFEFSNKDGQFVVAENGYVIESKYEGWLYSFLPVAINQEDNFKIECNLKKVEGVDSYGYGLMWGIKDDKNYYHFLVMGEGKFGVAKVQNGIFTDIISWSTPNSINRFNSTNKLTIERKDSQIQFFINDSFAGKMKFEPFFGNGIGFSVWNKQKIVFDDLVVTTYAADNTNKAANTVSSTYLFQDEFLDNRNGWGEGGNNDFRQIITDEKYAIENNKPGVYYMVVLANKQISIDQQKDFTIEAQMTFVNGNEERYYGFVWGVKDFENFHYFGITPNGNYVYTKKVNNEWNDLITRRPSRYIKQHSATNQISIKKRGSRLEFYINDAYVNSAPFEAFTGTIGFHLNDFMKVEVDYIRVKYD